MSRIHLVGLGAGWSLCPPMKEGREIWGINTILLRRPVSMVFEIHNFHEKLNRLDGHSHQRAIRTAGSDTPYMVREYWDFLPHLHQIVYPWDEVFDEFQTDLVGCTFDAMIALAICCGYDDIQVYGAGANNASHYDYQVPSNNYWVGVCHGRKLNIKFHQIGNVRHTDIMRTHDGLIYGLGKPQGAWPTIDNTLPACTCTQTPNGYCVDY